MSRLGELRHGIGEILGFAAAAIGAGRWPELSESHRSRRAALQASATGR